MRCGCQRDDIRNELDRAEKVGGGWAALYSSSGGQTDGLDRNSEKNLDMGDSLDVCRITLSVLDHAGR